MLQVGLEGGGSSRRLWQRHRHLRDGHPLRGSPVDGILAHAHLDMCYYEVDAAHVTVPPPPAPLGLVAKGNAALGASPTSRENRWGSWAILCVQPLVRLQASCQAVHAGCASGTDGRPGCRCVSVPPGFRNAHILQAGPAPSSTATTPFHLRLRLCQFCFCMLLQIAGSCRSQAVRRMRSKERFEEISRSSGEGVQPGGIKEQGSRVFGLLRVGSEGTSTRGSAALGASSTQHRWTSQERRQGVTTTLCM